MTSMIGLEIHEAASLGDYDALEEYIRSGRFDVNQGDLDWGDKTPLHWASQKGFAECVRLLLDNGAIGAARTETGWTPAHFAAESGRIMVLRALHSSNVRVDRKDNYGCTPRRLAEIYGHHDCVKFLQQAEQEIAERRQNLGLLNSSDEEDNLETLTAITFATEERSVDDAKRSGSRQRRRKDAVVSPTQSEGRKSRGSDISAASSEKRKSKDKTPSPRSGRKNKDGADFDLTGSKKNEKKKSAKSKGSDSASGGEGKQSSPFSKEHKKRDKDKTTTATNNKHLAKSSATDGKDVAKTGKDVTKTATNEGNVISIEEMFNTTNNQKKNVKPKNKR